MGTASSMCSSPSLATVIAPSPSLHTSRPTASLKEEEASASSSGHASPAEKKSTHGDEYVDWSHITVNNIIDKQDLKSLFEASRSLPIDPYFPQRKKGVCYASLNSQGKVDVSPDSYILQSNEVNHATGGFRREYEPMPQALTQSPAFHQILRTFKSRCGIPDDSSIIANVHVTIPTGLTLSKTESPTNGQTRSHRRQTVTGQGVHQDGVKYAAVFCLSRSEVEGVTNYIFREGHGGCPARCIGAEGNVMMDKILEPNEMVVWDDEKVWHYVSPPSFLSNEGERTAIVMGWPGNTSLDASVFSTPESQCRSNSDSDSDYIYRLGRPDSDYSDSDGGTSPCSSLSLPAQAYRCDNEW